MKNFLCFLIGMALLVGCYLSGEAQDKSADTIKIISVTTTKPVTRGVENEFTVEVEYNLDSKDEGIINLGFNTQKPTSFVMEDGRIVKKGSGNITLKAKIIVVDWGEKGMFMMSAILSEHPHGSNWQTLASEVKEIPIEQ
jgi:hypothetical protein